MDKVCTKCSELKPLSEFVKSKTTKTGYRGLCKTCFNSYYAKRRETHYDQVRSYEKKFHRARRLKYEYGITEEDYAKLLDDQSGKCAICNSSTKLVIDHCHSSGQVRGLLCTTCNTGLGMFKDTPDFLINAIKYLKGKYQ